MPKLAAAWQSWDNSSLALPEGAHTPQPSCYSSSELREGPCVPQGQQCRHGQPCIPHLCWKVQALTKTRGGYWASGCLAASQTQPCFSSPCSCPSGSHSPSVSRNNTEINKMSYHFYHCYVFGFTSTENVKPAFKRSYSERRVITVNSLGVPM